MDRADVIKFMKELWREALPNTYAEQACETAIELLQEGSRWIPCSERLPEDSGRYLISVLDGVGRRTTVALYQPRYKAWTMTGRMAYWKVIAWMPLPEPYKEE